MARLVWALFLVLLLAAPSGLAAWSVKGAREPDTAHDLTPGFLWPDPDHDPAGRRVYFNGFAAAGAGLQHSLNPNSAALSSSLAPAPFVALALLGIWKDCNRDGFVGLGDDGALEYRSELLPDVGVCPPAAPSEEAWTTHNDGTWVVELVPIGYDDITTPEDENPVQLNDTQARVWADWGLPGDAPYPACALLPAPRGAFRSTGGLVGYADCLLGQRAGPAPLDVANPWGAQGDAPMARVFACGGGTPVVVGDPTDGELDPLADENGTIASTTVRPLDPAVSPEGSPAGTVNETEAAIADCDRSDADEIVDTDGERAGSDGDLPYALEGGAGSTAPGARRARTDHALAFEEGVRSGTTAALLGARARDDAGAGAAAVTGFWVGEATAAVGRNAYVSRHSVAPEPVTYLTSYAYVSDVAIGRWSLLLPGGGASARYGQEGCALGTLECDPSRWWLDAAGDDVTPRDARLGADPANPTVPSQDEATRIGVRVGQRYQLRDVDCYDASVGPARDAGAHWGALTGTRCASP